MNANQSIACTTRHNSSAYRSDVRIPLVTPLIGAVVTAASGGAALVAATVLGMLFTGSYGPHEPVVAWANAHATDMYPTSHPLLVMAWCALMAAATVLSACRRRFLAVLLVGVAVSLPWAPALDFLYHLWQLAPAS